MPVIDKETWLKLDILQSLTESQRAIAKIMTSVADVTAMSDASARQVALNIEVIAKYQRVLANKIIVAMPISLMRQGSHGKPWLAAQVEIGPKSVK